MQARFRKPVSGWRAARQARSGGLLARDGAAFRLYRTCDQRTSPLGRVPAHVVARLAAEGGLQRFRQDPDRLHCPAEPVPGRLKALDLPFIEGMQAPALIDEMIAAWPGLSGRLRAVTTRFRADYELASLPGRLPVHPPDLLPAVRERLAGFDGALGSGLSMRAEAVLLDRLTLQAFQHVFVEGPDAALAAVKALAALYGLALEDQDAGSAFASA